MKQVRKAGDRGQFDHGWLKTCHTFSFADYVDPHHRGFRTLRVINEDWVAASQGFGTHPHQDMEIITYVLEGTLAHEDSMGNGSKIPAGDFQYMSAGTGVTHSEKNPSSSEAVHLFQIWIRTNQKGQPPCYGQLTVGAGEKAGKWRLVASPDGEAGSMAIRQDAKLYVASLQGAPLSYSLAAERGAWIQVVSGTVEVNGVTLGVSDGLAVEEESGIEVVGGVGAEVLLFDLG